MGLLVVVTGPSAAGKTLIVNTLTGLVPTWKRAITSTTRAPREGEVPGQSYHFLSLEEFVRRRELGRFLEWKENYGNLYGPDREEIRKQVDEHQVVFAVIDVKGARDIKKLMPESLVIFIDVTATDDLERRLRARSMPEDELVLRLKEIEIERGMRGDFDECFFNKSGRPGLVCGDVARAVLQRLPLPCT